VHQKVARKLPRANASGLGDHGERRGGGARGGMGSEGRSWNRLAGGGTSGGEEKMGTVGGRGFVDNCISASHHGRTAASSTIVRGTVMPVGGGLLCATRWPSGDAAVALGSGTGVGGASRCSDVQSIDVCSLEATSAGSPWPSPLRSERCRPVFA
jgi:hypothetical protein